MNPADYSILLEGLSIAERILLVEEIWDGIAAEAESMPITQAQRDELDRRLAAADANPAAGQTWQQVRAALQ
ncbi:MAG TPA: addiction module protein [Pirellulales bacterium]|jgi:putative addiction module component (TIGR02574 family)|nr:addiction module protein [Pirellulales bacterium]